MNFSTIVLPRYEPAGGFGKCIAVDESGIRIVVFAHGEFFEILELLEACTDILANEATPEFALLEGPHVTHR